MIVIYPTYGRYARIFPMIYDLCSHLIPFGYSPRSSSELLSPFVKIYKSPSDLCSIRQLPLLYYHDPMHNGNLLFCQIIDYDISWNKWLIPMSYYKDITSIIAWFHTASKNNNGWALSIKT